MVQSKYRRNDLEYHALDDFRPGIYGVTQFAVNQLATYSLAVPDGAAQITNTFGCVALPSGSLAPGPRVVALDAVSGETTVANNTIGISPAKNYIGGALAVGPVFPDSSPGSFSAFNENAYEALCFYSFTLWNLVVGTSSIVRAKYRVDKGWGAEVTQASTVTSLNTNNGNAFLIPGGWFADMQTIRSADVDRTLSGYPTVLGMYGFGFQGAGVDTGIAGGQMYIFPDINTAAGDTDNFAAFTPTGGVLGYMGIVHQGRAVWVQRPFANSSWSADGFCAYYSVLAYTDPNDIYSATIGKLIIPDLGLDGAFSLFSVNASELLILRGRGGAISIRGDLDNPTIVRYPGVQGTEGLPNVGTNSPIGYVYGSRAGVFAWRGGDESTYLSPQLPGAFWISQLDDDVMLRRKVNTGSFAFSDPYIFAPNNFMFDIRTESWWRYLIPGGTLDDSQATEATACGFHTTGPYSGDVYALYYSVPYVSNATWKPGFRIMKNSRNLHYKWTSQPLTWTKKRMTEIREIILLAQGDGTIAITLSSTTQPDGAKTATFSTNLHQDSPIRLSTESFHFIGTDVVVTIEATAGVNGFPAPEVHSIEFGEMSRQSITTVGA